MNAAELKEQLETMAHDVESGDGLSRLRDVEHRVRSERRRKIYVAAGAVASVAAIVLGSVLGLPSSHVSGPQPAKHWRLPTVIDHGVPFYTDPGGIRLIGHKVGQPGQSIVTLSVRTSSSDVVFSLVCTASSHYYVHLRLGDFDFLENQCVGPHASADPTQGMFYGTQEPVTSQLLGRTGGANRPPASLRAYVWSSKGLNGARVTVPNAQVGVAVYDASHDRVVSHGMHIARRVVFADHTYQLVADAFRHLTTSGTVNLRLPKGLIGPLIVPGIGSWSSKFRISLAGRNQQWVSATQTPYAFGLLPALPGSKNASVTIHGRPGSNGTLFELLYRRID